jgi:hypothetical protein
MFSPTKLFVALLALSYGSSVVSGQINSPNASLAIGMATTLNVGFLLSSCRRHAAFLLLISRRSPRQKQVVFNETYDILWDGTEPRFVDVYV